MKAHITDEEVHDPVDSGEYRHIIGKLMYASVSTRPDIAFAVGFLGRFASAPTTYHLNMAKYLLRYLKGASNIAITFPRTQGKVELVGYTDADWGESKDRKSTGGYLFLINGAPVSWASKKQTVTALSSTESEYMAATQATKEAVWLRRLLEEMGFKQETGTIIMEDNKSCISLAENPIPHHRTKHIDIQQHFIREKIEDESISLVHVSTTEQLADVMTKALPKPKHLACIQGMGLYPSRA